MPDSNTAKAREFLRRYQHLSQHSGYNLVYDTLALIEELIPCWAISFIISRPKTSDIDDVELATVPLLTCSPALAPSANLFFGIINQIDFAKKFLSMAMRCAVSGDVIQSYSFSDHPRHNKGFTHYFYKLLNCSDFLVAASLLGRNQFADSPYTASYYAMVCNLAHNNGQFFTQEEKDLAALCFDIFIDDFKKKISPPGHSPFLPQITGEIICEKTKLKALFDTGSKYSPRQLATIKACFDLKQQKRKITCREVARYLYLQDQDPDEAALKKASAKVDHDLGKIKDQLLRDFPPGSADYAHYKKTFRIEHLTDIFQTYAYFGLYPDTAKRYSSYLERRLGKWG